MSSADKIDIEELRTVVNTLLDHLRDGGVSEVQLAKDYHWEIDASELYEVTNDPADLTVGSLFEDWESARQLAAGTKEPVVLLLSKVAPLLRYIADSVTEVQLSRPSKPTA